MSTNKSNKGRIIIAVLCIIVGCVLACSSIISNDYLKLALVMGSLGFGLFGIMKGLSNPNNSENVTTVDEK